MLMRAKELTWVIFNCLRPKQLTDKSDDVLLAIEDESPSLVQCAISEVDSEMKDETLDESDRLEKMTDDAKVIIHCCVHIIIFQFNSQGFGIKHSCLNYFITLSEW